MPENDPRRSVNESEQVSLDQLRADGIVPDDDIIGRAHQINNHMEAVMDGNGTVHIANPSDDPPRERLLALSRHEAAELADWLAENTHE